jgi:hypothetical protein
MVATSNSAGAAGGAGRALGPNARQETITMRPAGRTVFAVRGITSKIVAHVSAGRETRIRI